MKNKNIEDIESNVESNIGHHENDPTSKKGWVKRSFNAVRRAAFSVGRGLDSLSESINNSPAMSAMTSGSAMYAMQKHNMIDTPSIQKDSGASMVFTGVSAVTLSSYMKAEKERARQKTENVQSVEDNLGNEYQKKKIKEAIIQPDPQKQAQPMPNVNTSFTAKNNESSEKQNEEKRGWFKRAAGGIKKVVNAIDSFSNSVNETMRNSPGMSAATSGSALYAMQKHNMIKTPNIEKDSGTSLAFTGVSAVTLASYMKESKNKNQKTNKPNSFEERLKAQVSNERGNEPNKPSVGLDR